MNNLMIDIETLGTRPGAAVISIGAVFFEPSTGALGKTFYRNINQQHAAVTRLVDADTLDWWKKQSQEAKDAFKSPLPISLVDALQNFTAFTREHGPSPKNLKPWGNGATFDIVILENCFEAYVLEFPWRFWNIRDVRTIVDLADGIVSKGEIEGTAHNALDDAIYQAKYVSAMWQALTRRAA